MAVDHARPMSRRALVAGSLGALGGALVAGLARPLPAEAATDQASYLNNENDAVVIQAESRAQVGFAGSGAGVAVRAITQNNFAVRGTSVTLAGVFGESSTDVGVYGESASAPGVQGVGFYGVYGVGRSKGVAGILDGTGGQGVYGGADDAESAGVRGNSTNGRGGSFKGKKAQVKLEPSGAASHPARGQRGDLFVDKSGRLWFCKGGTTWVKLA